MFTKLFYKLYNLQMRITIFFGGCPATYDHKKQKFYLTRWSVLKHYFHISVVSIYSVFLAIQLVLMKLAGDLEHFNVTMSFFCANNLFSICAFSTQVVDPEDTVRCVNGLFKYPVDFHSKFPQKKLVMVKLHELFFQNFLEKWTPKRNPEASMLNWYTDRLIATTMLFSVLTPFLFFSHYFLVPNAPMYPTALIPDKYFTGFYIFFAIGYIWFLQMACSTFTSIFIIILSYTVFIVPLVSREFKANQLNYQTLSSLRSPKNFTLAYRSLEILHKHLLGITSVAILPLKYTLTKLSLFCNYILIKQWNELDATTATLFLLLTFVFSGFWVFILNFGGLLQIQGKLLLKSWKEFNWAKKDMKLLSKFRKSCKPFCVNSGKYFHMNRLSSLKFLRGLATGTFRTLVALK